MNASDEFPPGAAGPLELPADGVSRRRFLGLMGASAALAAGVSCSKIDRGAVVPYTKRPGEVIPGLANYYASTFQEGLLPYGVLVKTREGRPVHIEGNDEHPLFAGKTSPRAIADLLRLYDPDRLRQPLVSGRPASWEAAMTEVAAAVRASGDEGRDVLLITGAVRSPSRAALIEELRGAVPRLVHAAYEPLAPHAEISSAREVFGEFLLPRLRFDLARVVVSFACDFLGVDGNGPAAIRAFAAGRGAGGPAEETSRLWVLEGRMSLTGARADHRISIRPSQCAPVAFALARTLALAHGFPLPGGMPVEALGGFDLDEVARRVGVAAGLLRALAADMARAGRASLAFAGATAPLEAHVACHLLNAMLGGEGHTVETAFAARPDPPAAFAGMRALLESAADGGAGTAIFWGVDPAYSFPHEELWKRASERIPRKVFIGLHGDETAAECGITLPEHHWLEAWGDYEVSTDLLSLQQPAVGPLYETRQGEDVLLGILRSLGSAAPGDYHDYVRLRWRKEVYPAGCPVPFDQYWNGALHDGLLRIRAAARPARAARGEAVARAALRAREALSRIPGDVFELEPHAATTVYDGRYGNNGWLQEMPDPITKTTWSNPAAVSPTDASRLGLADGDVARIEIAGGGSVDVPVIVQPGQAPGVVSLAVGYGRRTCSVASGVGVNCWRLADPEALHLSAAGVARLARTGRRVDLPLTQRHHRMEGRDIARTRTAAGGSHAAAHAKGHEIATLSPRQEYPEHKWGIVVDLAACVGCGGCVIACQSENNIPVVGPEQVLRGREMHWIRVDRYYEGPPGSPRVVHLPMLCQQCDNAPCENVCPVNATTHSPDGLNQMTYNRCVGTRYCANNCPYKVRRFNFFEFTAAKKEPESLALNPEVTVRPRGVMEKCTFCVQRIQEGRQRARVEGRPLRDGAIIPACAAACPAGAIVFGDLKDPDSRVSRLSAGERGYKILEELGVRPAVTYLENVRNPAVEDGGHEG